MKTYYYLTLLLLAITSAVLTSCNSKESQAGRVAQGGVEYGHVFRLNEVDDIRSMFPLNITEATGYRVANQAYEGLVKFDQKTLEPVAAIASSWDVSDDARVWTFHLREGVFFHDDPCFEGGKGRELTAEDVAWCVRQLCTASPQNQMFWLAEDRIAGANEYYHATMTGADLPELPGVEVLDEHTIRFNLLFPCSGFLQLLGHNGFFIYPVEAQEYYGADMAGHAVGTGPFVLKVFKQNEMAVLERNPNYWGVDEHGNQLPYLDAIQISFVRDKKSELLKFKNGELDMVFTLPIEMYADVMSSFNDLETSTQNFDAQVTPSMSILYYAFQHEHPVFSDVRVRRAFNLAIDRGQLINHTLQGEGTPGEYGIIPPAFHKYNHRKLSKTSFDPEKARALLAEAGYPNGDGFPVLTLELASGGTNNELVAQAVTGMLEETLGIEIELQVLPMAEVLDHSESGTSAFWRDGWVADYPDPENFLRLFVSDTSGRNPNMAYLNSVRYRNPFYDSIFYEAVHETDESTRYDYYQLLDQILINDAVVMPIYYEEFTRLVNRNIHNFPQNSIEYRDFSAVWISSDPAP